MSAQDVVFKDIFEGADAIEILGKLPSILWAYIEKGRSLVTTLETSPSDFSQASEETKRMLGAVESASQYLANEELKDFVGVQAKMLAALVNADLSAKEFIDSFTPMLRKLEAMAGPRPESGVAGMMDKRFFEQDLDIGEEVKKGRSRDLVVSIDVLNDIHDCLSKSAVTEGISSILIIDNAGTLIVSVGDKIELDAVSLAAVSAANFAATEKIARLIGERDFVLLFYKGHNESFHFSRVGTDYIVVTIFDNSLSLGLLRLKIAEVSRVIEKKLPTRQG